MKIATLTLCPAYDLHCFSKNFTPFSENLADLQTSDAGGKGINISRALSTFSVESRAIIALGEDNCRDFEDSLKKSNTAYIPLYVKGRIRQNVTVHTDNNKETRISFHGFKASSYLLERASKQLRDFAEGDILTFSGRLPEGISSGDAADFLLKFKERGVRIVIDSRSFSLEDIVKVSPWLIKPNEEEIEKYIPGSRQSEEEMLEGAEKMFASGVENVTISLGEKGAYLICKDGNFYCHAPKIAVKSTIGAGDAFLAGFIYASSLGLSSGECLKYSVAFGSAACLENGTNPPQKAEIERLVESM